MPGERRPVFKVRLVTSRWIKQHASNGSIRRRSARGTDASTRKILEFVRRGGLKRIASVSYLFLKY